MKDLVSALAWYMTGVERELGTDDAVMSPHLLDREEWTVPLAIPWAL